MSEIEEKRTYSQFMSAFFPPPFDKQVKFDCEDTLACLTPFVDAYALAKFALREVNSFIFQKKFQTPANSHSLDIVDSLELEIQPITAFSLIDNVIDCTGGLGGNTIGFLKALAEEQIKLNKSKGLDEEKIQNPIKTPKSENVEEGEVPKKKKLTFLELDDVRFECGVHNLNLFRKQFDPQNALVDVQYFKANFLRWVSENTEQLKKDGGKTCLFFDPPWGGAEYKKQESITDLCLEDDAAHGNRNIGMRKIIDKMMELGILCVVLKAPYNYNDRTLTEGNHRRRLVNFVMKKVKYVMIINGKFK